MMFRNSLLIFAASCFYLAQPVSVSADADALAADLLKEAPYLLSEPQKTELDHINRDLREIRNTLRRERDSQDAVEKNKIQERLQHAESALHDLLRKIPNVETIQLGKNGDVLPRLGTIELPGDRGGILMKLVDESNPSGNIEFQATQCEFAEQSDLQVSVPKRAGTIWVLCALDHIPDLLTDLTVRLSLADGGEVQMPLRVHTPQKGRIRVAVLSDDTKKPCPAMIRLIWKANGRNYKPGNAIDFASQLDHQGDATGNRNARYFPGELSGRYWCVPEPFDLAVPPGEWEITIRRGVEHIPVTETFTVTSGEVVERTYRPERWVDMRDYGWYSGDDHVHCQILSDADAERLMAWVQAEDIHLANVVKMGDISRTWFEQRGFGKLYRVIDKDFILSPGQECPRTHQELGHTMAMNTTSMVRDTDQYYLYDWVFDNVHAQGGLAGYCHVVGKLFHVHRDMSINIPKGKVDFVELMQFGQLNTDWYYDFLNTGFKMTASAGSDVPWGGTIGEVRVYAYVGKKRFHADAWFEALERGRTFVTNGPMLTLEVDKALPGDEIRLDEDKTLRIRARVWGSDERTLPSKLEIVQFGETIRTVQSERKDQEELNLDFEIKAEDGFWIAARAEGRDGTAAHTTPVYVVRDDLRFWKFEEAKSLIEKRRVSLNEIEKVVKDAQNANSKGELEGNRTLKQLALQGSALMERVNSARAIYDRLEDQIETERAIRTSN